MNLFFLDIDIQKSAEYHCNKHVVKMIIEIVQMLYTAHHLNGKELPSNCYRKLSNHNHPMAIWVRTSKTNYDYTVSLGINLSLEYTYRYNKIHSCDNHLKWLSENIDKALNILNVLSIELPLK